MLAVGAGTLVEYVTFTSTTGRVLRVTVGATLVVLGLVQLNRITVNLRRFEPALHGALRRQAALRGFGLTGPILAIKAWGGRILIAVGAWFNALGLAADYYAGLFPV